MTNIVLYALVAIFLLLATLWLFRKTAHQPEESHSDAVRFDASQLDGISLRLAERIFDARDPEWLDKDLCFPEAAAVLERHRKALAIQWLKALRNSFKAFVRMPEPATLGAAQSESSAGRLLWLTLRFHFLINYALLMVRLFGPYHRMVPILGTLRSVRNLGLWKSREDRVSAGKLL